MPIRHAHVAPRKDLYDRAKGGSPDFGSRNASETALTLTMFTQPEHSNSLGNVRGGVILKLCDECGGIIAARHARRPAVTVTIDSVNFLQRCCWDGCCTCVHHLGGAPASR